MGTLRVPPSGSVYLDANSVIYSVERHPAFAPLLLPLWQAAQSKSIEIISSELTLMETLVGAFKSLNAALIHAYEQIFQQPQTRLLPITRAILREAAQLRVTTKLKTPDAVHAATALSAGCTLFVTNDVGFRSVARLPLTILADLLTP